ncbi:MAG: PQQ-binding-like beta-propeller repeat protein [Planctomycetota bacterium]|nr:PQQ-binding-like beta-propeller repeat protein [Planctomycetota bacterium]
MIKRTLLLLFATAVMLFAAPREGTGAEPVHRWILDADHHSNGRFQPTRGNWNAFPQAEPVFRQNTGGYQLDGETHFCVVGKEDQKPVVPGDLPTKALGIEAWVYIDRLEDWNGIASAIQDNGDFERGWMLGIRNQSFCFGLTSSTVQRLTYLDASEPIEPGNWYHVAASYDGARMRLYVDGRLSAESAAQKGPILYPPETLCVIGAYHDSNEHHPLKGAIASLAIYDQAPPVADFKSHYQEQRAVYEAEHPIAEVITGWPTYMRDNRRSGTTPEKLELPLHCQWEYHSHLAPRPAWPPPAPQNFWSETFNLRARVIFDRAFHLVSDGKAVFFGSSADNQVVSLDITTGTPRWRYLTAGPVRLAPTLQKDRLYVGSDDGHLYCRDTNRGKKKWRYLAAPSDRMIPGNNRIISAWPIRTGALLDRGVLRIGSGLFPTQGPYQHSVDPESGKRLASGSLDFSPQGYMQRRGTRLMVAQGRAPQAAMGALARAPKPEPTDRPGSGEKVVFSGITAGDTHFLATDDGLVAMDRRGNQLWKADLEGNCYSLAIVGGRLLASTDEGVIYCFSHTERPNPAILRERVSLTPPWETPSPSDSKTLVATIREQITKSQGFIPRSGYALVTGDNPLGIASTLHSHFPFRVIVVPPAGADLQSLREKIRLGGIAGEVVVHDPVEGDLPYADNLFNLVLSTPQARSIMPAEITRVLRPSGGVAVIAYDKLPGTPAKDTWQKHVPRGTVDACGPAGRWLSISKPPAEGVGQWNHIYGSAANTACSEDQLVRGQLSLQWFGGPGPRKMIDRHHRTVPPLVSHGRMFIPADNRIICVDAYNGSVNWETPVPASRRVGALRDAGSMTATSDYLYIVSGETCLALSVATGKAEITFKAPLPATDARHWGYIAREGKQLVGSTTRVGASRTGLSRQQISETYYDFIPIVTSDSLFSTDRHSGRHHWQYIPTGGAIINPTITTADGTLYFVESTNPATLSDPDGRSTPKQLLSGGAHLVAIDLESGSLSWRREIDVSRIEHHLYLSYAQGTLLAVGSRNATKDGKSTVWYDVHAYDASSGERRWTATQDQGQNVGGSHGEQDHHPTIVGDTIYVEPQAYSIKTGERRPGWQLQRGGHGCGSLSASAHTLFFRAGTATMSDLVTGQRSKVTTVSRPGCWINMIPANGMLLIPEASSGCTCDLAIQTSMAFVPSNQPTTGEK